MWQVDLKKQNRDIFQCIVWIIEIWSSSDREMSFPGLTLTCMHFFNMFSYDNFIDSKDKPSSQFANMKLKNAMQHIVLYIYCPCFFRTMSFEEKLIVGRVLFELLGGGVQPFFETTWRCQASVFLHGEREGGRERQSHIMFHGRIKLRMYHSRRVKA